MGTSTNDLPNTTTDPYKLSEQGVRLEGDLPIAELRRAGDLLVSDQGKISATLDFGRDEENRHVVRGRLQARVWVTCQRCLEPMEENVESRFELALVSDDDSARQVPSHYEPLVTGPGGGIKVREVVEDELLLAMAPFPMHPEDECNVDIAVFEQEAEQSDTAAADKSRKKPFELLKGLLDSEKDDSSRH